MEYLLSKFKASDMIIGCPFSLECLIKSTNLQEMFCNNYENCPALLLCERIERESPAFWKLIWNTLNVIKPNYLDPRLFIVGIRRGVEIEKKNFLSLLLLYFSKKDLNIFNLISQEHIESILAKMKSFKDIFQEISEENLKLSEIISDGFKDLLLSDFSQKGIRFLLDIFCQAEKESKKPIPQPSEDLFKHIGLFLKSRSK